MSKPSRRLARRTRTEGWPMGPRPASVGYVTGWCTDDEASRRSGLSACEELLRFALPDQPRADGGKIEGIAGPVRFHVIDGHRAHLFLAARSREANDPLLKEYLTQLRAKLRDRGGLILVASAVASSVAAARGCQSRALREGISRAGQG